MLLAEDTSLKRSELFPKVKSAMQLGSFKSKLFPCLDLEGWYEGG